MLSDDICKVWQSQGAGPSPLTIEEIRASELGAWEKRALLLGLLSHIALDLELHPLVNACAERDARLRGGAESHHHYLAEKYHSLFFHLDRFGEDIVGRPRFFREDARLLADRSFFLPRAPRPLLDLFRASLRRTHGAAPSRLQVAGWIRNFHQLAFLIALPFAARNSTRTRTAENRRRYYDGPGVLFASHYARAEKRLKALAHLGLEYFESPRFDEAQRKRFDERAGIEDLARPAAAEG